VGKQPPILGYGGFWLRAGEAHISTLAVRPNWRRRGIGELLLVTLLDRATELDAERATLEVRVSNVTAQSLYRKYGFQRVGLKHQYYRDQNEDALTMSTERLTSATFQGRFQRLKRALRERLARSLDKMP
jgi:ribosomal-protein-alanine N-acetyltransferase